MPSTQRKTSGVMVESRIRPSARSVTLGAGLWKIRTHVIRICSALEVLQVTRNACRVGQGEVVIGVAIRALPRRYRMRSRQREIGEVMVEGGVQPIRGVVALRTIRWEITGDMVRVRRGLKIFQVATRTCGGAQVVIVVDVAVGAFTRRNSMSTGQQESGRGVIKFCVQPVIGAVATVACGGEFGGDVIGITGRLKILRVARIASRRHRFKLAVRRAFVTSIAIDSSMCSRQGKAIIVLLDLLGRYSPSAHGVALLAIGS
jgi:hypothetical protein